MLALYVLVPAIHLARARLPFYERDKVIANLGSFIFDSVFMSRVELLNRHGGLSPLDFHGKKERMRILQIQTKFQRGQRCVQERFNRFAWNRQLASNALPLVL